MSGLADLGDGHDLVAAALTQQLAERAAYMAAAAEVIDALVAAHDRELEMVGAAVVRLMEAVEKNRATADAHAEALQASAAHGKTVEFLRDHNGRLTGLREVPLAPDGLHATGYLQRRIDDLLSDVDLDDDHNGNGAA